MFPNKIRLQGVPMAQQRCALRVALLATVLVAVTACSQQHPTATRDSIRSLPFSVVATGDSRAEIRHASTFSWGKDLQQTSAVQPADSVQIDSLLQEAIIANMQGKGYRYSREFDTADLSISYRVAMDTTGVNRVLPETYGEQLQPSLNITSPDARKYEKGTLVIEVTDRKTGLTAWHSALQGFANHELNTAQRRQRIQLMVDRMLAGVPAK
jgi:hypothetical protein